MAPLDAIARTSLLTAALRAEETRRPDRLYEDPLAARLVGALGGDLLGQVADASGPRDTDPGQGDPGRHVSGRKVPSTVDFNAIRTRYFDEYLLTQVRDGGYPQVVMVAAGMDTRAHRLPWPRAIELFVGWDTQGRERCDVRFEHDRVVLHIDGKAVAGL
ncbi:class I SAM-dependent methyltransferase, partial [Streptomyces asiaticus]